MKWLLGLGILFVLPRLASADAMVWEEYVYRTRVDGNTVTICSDNVSPSMCGWGVSSPTPVMIRQDTKTKEVVEIPDAQQGVLDPKLCPSSACCRSSATSMSARPSGQPATRLAPCRCPRRAAR